MRTHMATLGDDLDPSVAVAVGALRAAGYELTPLRFSSSRLPRRSDKKTRKTARSFQHTPEVLLDSWHAAHWLASETDPGDVIVIGDRAGMGGVFALLQAACAPADRRRVWTVAGDAVVLETRLTTGTTDGVEMPEAAVLDWELTQYRFSAEVLATSQLAIDYLDEIGVEASLVTVAEPPQETKRRDAADATWAPGAVSRRNNSGEVMRAVASVPEIRLTVANSDAEDRIWSGTTWDALSGIRNVLGDRLVRGDRSSTQPSHVIVGDALTPPDAVTSDLRRAGVPMLVVRRGVAAAMWPEAATWETADDLAALLAGDPPSATIPTSRWTGPSEPDPPDESRARRVSVGVPVFGDVRFLDECVESILAQDQPPHEVVLIDDGSVSVAVDTALAAWRDTVPDVVRIDRQPNRGVCVARNRMIESMTGDAFLLVDQDDVLDSCFISSTAQALRQDRSLWAVAAWTEFFGDYEGIEAKPPFDRRVGVRENPIVSTAALVDIAVRDRGIRFSPDLAFLCCEDWHVWSQIIAAGGRMGLVPEPLIRHRVHRASGGFQRTELAHRVGRARAIEPLLGSDPG